jgi:hypothetical protein
MDTLTIDLVDPATYTAHRFEPMFDWLRRNAPLFWAVIGSGLRLGHNPHPDRVVTVRALLDAGADPDQAWAGQTFPEVAVARLLVERGIDVPGKDIAAMRHSLGLDSEQGRPES